MSSKNRDRLLDGKLADLFFSEVVAETRRRKLLTDGRFRVDGTLIEACAGTKSFRRRDTETGPTHDPGKPPVDFRGEKRRNETEASTTDPEALLYRKSGGTEAKLRYLGHVVMEVRHGLAVESRVTMAGGTFERKSALALIEAATPGIKGITLKAVRGYDSAESVQELRFFNVTHHVAQNVRRGRSAIERPTTRPPSYALSQRHRKRLGNISGWLKTVGLMRKVNFRELHTVGWMFRLSTAVYNLGRIRNLEAAARA